MDNRERAALHDEWMAFAKRMEDGLVEPEGVSKDYIRGFAIAMRGCAEQLLGEARAAIEGEPAAPAPDNPNDTMEYWRTRAITAEQKVLMFHEQITSLARLIQGEPKWPSLDPESGDFTDGWNQADSLEAALASPSPAPSESLREALEKTIGLIDQSIESFTSGSPYVLTYSDIRNVLRAALNSTKASEPAPDKRKV